MWGYALVGPGRYPVQRAFNTEGPPRCCPTDLHCVLAQPPESLGNNEPVGIGDMNRAGLFPVIPAQAGIQCFQRLAGFRSQPVPAKTEAGMTNLELVGQQWGRLFFAPAGVSRFPIYSVREAAASYRAENSSSRSMTVSTLSASAQVDLNTMWPPRSMTKAALGTLP